MNAAPSIAYVGFEVKTRVREYSFLVKAGAEEPRVVRLTIPHEAFLSHRARYQDGPDICAHRLHRELNSEPDGPPQHHYTISDEELEAYHSVHYPKPKPRAMYKPQRDE